MPNLTETEIRVLRTLKSKLQELLGDRLKIFRLFGSKARGDADVYSDLDVAIVVEELSGELKRRVLDCVVEVEFDFLTPVSSFVLSTEEFHRLKARERRIALDIEEEGVPL